MGLLPYEVLSRYYQKLLYDADYDKWTEYLLTLVEKHAVSRIGADVGCGTGIFTRKLKKAGFDVCGVDISASMLTVAETLTRKDKVKIDYIKGDMRSIALFNKVGFISVVNDGLNYIEQKDIKRTFKSFNKCLLKGGLLMFDLSTEHKLKNVLNGQMYGDDGEELSYIWLSEYDNSENKLDISLSFFEKQGDVYKRYNEFQTQYAHSVEYIKNSLLECGFEPIAIKNAFGGEIDSEEERVLFVAIKK